jgi:glycerol-3-phosphate dehydrogenase
MNSTFSTKQRGSLLEQMAAKELDLIVIGGGITGAGIAWDASSRGLDTGLLEMNDFASGTSSRSTKLVHGGLRYLKQGEFKLVRDIGRERAILHQNAPHIVIRHR